MSPPHDQDAPLAPSPQQKYADDDPPPAGGVIEIPLTTQVNGNTISIVGQGNASLAQNRGATAFKFILNDTSGGQVQFTSLDAADGITTCPPTGSGNQSSQIVGVVTHNNASPKTARFTDNNSNMASNGTLNVSYQWNFTCSATFNVLPFDPIISNGGKTGPI